jgi:hypothetical protein
MKKFRHGGRAHPASMIKRPPMRAPAGGGVATGPAGAPAPSVPSLPITASDADAGPTQDTDEGMNV